MEQQPGPVNWGAHNPAPAPGAVRLWTWQAIAHGAEIVSYFRWRQLPFAQEQMHSGLLRPDDVLDRGGEEARETAREIGALAPGPAGPSPVALVVDPEAHWMFSIQPQLRGYSAIDETWRWYSAARRLGLDIDVVPPAADLARCRLVLVPVLAAITPSVLARFASTGATILYGARTGSKTERFAIPAELPPGALQALLPIKVARVESLRADMPIEVRGEVQGRAVGWREVVESELAPAAGFADGGGALFCAGRHHYLACRPDDALLGATLRRVAEAAGLRTIDLPEGLRLRRCGELTFAFNFGSAPQIAPAPPDAVFVLGGREVGPVGVAAWKG
jgi:beta-galactosidase